MDTATKAGIGVGVAVGVLLILILLFWFCMKRRKQQAWQDATPGTGFEKPSPWPSLRRIWKGELSGQHDRPELEGSRGGGELHGSSPANKQSNLGVERAELSEQERVAELSEQQRVAEMGGGQTDKAEAPDTGVAEMSATAWGPIEPYEVSGDPPERQVDGLPEAESEPDQSNPPPIPYASKPRK